jgi:hypothetical protein
MERRRAILVDIKTNTPLTADWKPTIWPSELETANQNLEKCNMSYRWQWAGKVITLCGSVELQARARDAQLQLGATGERC